MATPKIDYLAISFLKRIPDTFKSTFTPGSGAMPDGYVLTADQIMTFLNQAMLQLFNMKWSESMALSGGSEETAIKVFSRFLPGLVKFSATLDTDPDFQGVVYDIKTPHFDIFKIIGAIGKDNQYIKIWDPSKFSLVASEEYEEYTATEENPAAIQMDRRIFIFPSDLTNFEFKLQYIKLPINPETGDYFVQNGDYDSPFSEQWNEVLIQMAYDIYLSEAKETE